MSSNINTRDYWDHRFASGDWEAKQGRWQTHCFAVRQARLLRIPRNFNGTILDFGCGLGDAIPVFRKRFPMANFFGLDHSEKAIDLCRTVYGDLATFVHGDCDAVPDVDVIITSNVLEHLDNDVSIAEHLVSKCSELYIFVPYREPLLFEEHVNSYDEDCFAAFQPSEIKVFPGRKLFQEGWGVWFNIYMKNLLRPFFGKPLARRSRQIMYRLPGRRAPIAEHR